MSEQVRTIDDFLRVLRRSGLVDEARIAEVAAAWPDHAADLPGELVQGIVDKGLVTPWQAERLRAGHSSFMLGKHRILGLLGRGGMSNVFLAEHTSLHVKRAIKVLPSDRIDQSSYLERFKREARAAANLRHPNIVQAFDLELEGKTKFIAMEYVEGIDLHQKVKQEGPLSVRDAVTYVQQAALGLHYAHTKGFVHRDVKPANLMLDREGAVKVLDLGLAAATAEDDGSLTRAHDEKVLGTADYLAPEQARDSHKADGRSDIYSLGCTLYYLLVGRPPYAKGTLAERIKAHLDDPPPNLLIDREDVPPEISNFYRQMLEKHPDARPQTAQEVADTLNVWLQTTAPSTAGTGRTPPPRREKPRRAPGDSGIAAASRPSAPGPASRPATRAGRGARGGGQGSGIGPTPRPGPGSGIDLGSLSLTPPPSSGSRSTLPGPARGPVGRGRAPAPPARGAPHPASAAEPRRPARAPLTFAGLPLGFWIIVGGIAVLAIVLGVWVLISRTGRSKPRRALDDIPTVVAPKAEKPAEPSALDRAIATPDAPPEE